jgi:hypothetical protein
MTVCCVTHKAYSILPVTVPLQGSKESKEICNIYLHNMNFIRTVSVSLLQCRIFRMSVKMFKSYIVGLMCDVTTCNGDITHFNAHSKCDVRPCNVLLTICDDGPCNSVLTCVMSSLVMVYSQCVMPGLVRFH